MKREMEDMIWAYLDGTCSRAEQERVEELLGSDQQFRDAFHKSKLLHRELQAVEVEMPSMRFVQNVMDKLPAVKNLATTPLVSTKWLRTFGWTLAGMLAFFWGGSALIIPQDAAFAEETGEMVSLLEWLARLSAKGVSGPLFFAGIVFLSLLGLLLLDRWLQSRFGRLKQS